MKRLLIYLVSSVLMLAVTTPALAQVPQEDIGGVSDQYNGFPGDPCAGLSGSSLNECLIESYPPGSEYNSTIEDPCAGLSGAELEGCLAGGNGPDVLTCADYYNYEIPPLDIPEECNPGGDADGRNVVPEANKSSDQTFEGFSNTLSAIRSGGRNKAEAKEIEADKPSSQPEPREPDDSDAIASDANKPAPPFGSGNANEAVAENSAPKNIDVGQEAEGEQVGSGIKKNNGKNDVESKNSDDSENSSDSENDAVSENEASVEDKENTGNGSSDAVAGASDATVLSNITELPQTSGVSFVLLGVGVLLVVGGLAASRLSR